MSLVKSHLNAADELFNSSEWADFVDPEESEIYSDGSVGYFDQEGNCILVNPLDGTVVHLSSPEVMDAIGVMDLS